MVIFEYYYTQKCDISQKLIFFGFIYHSVVVSAFVFKNHCFWQKRLKLLVLQLKKWNQYQIN